jgi:catecholate siderophore receptor
VNLWLRKDFRGGLNAAFGFRYLSEQFTDNDNELTLDSYGIAAAAVGYRTPRWDWTVNIDNLFNNKDYFLPGHFSNNAFPGAPINANTTVRLKWN